MFGVYSNNAGNLQQITFAQVTDVPKGHIMDYLSGLDLNNAVSDVDEEAKKATTENLSRIAGLFLKELTGGLSADPVVAKRQTDDMLVGLAAGNSVFAAAAPAAAPAPAPAPLVLGAGSPAPAPAAPIAPLAPSQAEIIGQDFLNRFPAADVTSVMDFLDNARNTGLTFERSVRALQSIGGSPNPDQLLALVEQLVTRVKSGRESLITDPSNGTVSLKTIADFTTREVGLKQDLLDIASAIKGSPVTITAAGTRPVVQSATATANTLRTERAELVDAIVREFSVTGPTGSQTMAAFVAAAKAAVAGTTAPIPAPTGVLIDLLTEINTTTPIRKEASEADRAYADRIIKVLVGAVATEMLCDNMVADNGLVGVRPDMDLLHKTHALFGKLAARRLPMTTYVVSAMPTI